MYLDFEFLIERKYRSHHVVIIQALVIGCAECTTITDDDPGGDGFEIGAKVLHRFECDNLF